MDFEGVLVPAVAPCRNDDERSLDLDGLGAVVEHIASSGAHAVIVGGTTGEAYAHTLEERAACIRRAREAAGGRVPVIVGAGAIRTEDACAVAREAREAGCDGLMISSPPYAVPSEEENAAHAVAVQEAGGLPAMLYNFPARTGVEMGERFLALVSRAPGFRAIKESSGDAARVRALATRWPSLALSVGSDDAALEFFAWGARSWVAAGANFLPGPHVALWRACVEDGDFALGRRMMAALLPVLEQLENGGAFLPSVKCAMELRGLPGGPPRRPLQPLGAEARAALARLLEEADAGLAAAATGGGDGGLGGGVGGGELRAPSPAVLA